jgi:hypothetical protein
MSSGEPELGQSGRVVTFMLGILEAGELMHWLRMRGVALAVKAEWQLSSM